MVAGSSRAPWRSRFAWASQIAGRGIGVGRPPKWWVRMRTPGPHWVGLGGLFLLLMGSAGYLLEGRRSSLTGARRALFGLSGDLCTALGGSGGADACHRDTRGVDVPVPALDLPRLYDEDAKPVLMMVSLGSHIGRVPKLANASGFSLAAFVVRIGTGMGTIEKSSLIHPDRLRVVGPDAGRPSAFRLRGKTSNVEDEQDELVMVRELVKAVHDFRPQLIVPIDARAIELLHRVQHALTVCSSRALAAYGLLVGEDAGSVDGDRAWQGDVLTLRQTEAAVAAFLDAVQGPASAGKHAAATNTKAPMTELARSLDGVHAPASVSVVGLSEAEAAEVSAQFVGERGFPVVVKQAIGHGGGQEVAICRDQAELDAALETHRARALKYGCSLFAQDAVSRSALEFTGGPDGCTKARDVVALLSASVYPRAVACDVSLNEFIERDGVVGGIVFSAFRGELVGSTPLEFRDQISPVSSLSHWYGLMGPKETLEARRAVAKFVSTVGYHGIGCIDWIRQKGSGVLYLIEMNPRSCGFSTEWSSHEGASQWALGPVLAVKKRFGDITALEAAKRVARLQVRALASECAGPWSGALLDRLRADPLALLEIAFESPQTCLPRQKEALAVHWGSSHFHFADPLAFDLFAPDAVLAPVLRGVSDGTTFLDGEGFTVNANLNATHPFIVQDLGMTCANLQSFRRKYNALVPGDPFPKAVQRMFQGDDDGGARRDRVLALYETVLDQCVVVRQAWAA